MLSVINESDFKVNNGIYAVKFWATWCQPCKVLNPTLEKLESEFTDIKFLSIDVDQIPTLAQEYKIKTVPTILVFDNGKEINRIVGLSLIEPMRKIFRDLSSSSNETRNKISQIGNLTEHDQPKVAVG